jgi:hypothetical protein
VRSNVRKIDLRPILPRRFHKCAEDVFIRWDRRQNASNGFSPLDGLVRLQALVAFNPRGFQFWKRQIALDLRRS